ncbi:MAG: HNH endonuclease family protein, partial [Candidatus Limisoma sp.]|nr:HNH endonuclease family protein [Candidatus Limisoma sp.]
SSNYTNYRWFNWLMDEVVKTGLPNVDELYHSLKAKADNEFPIPNYERLSYNEDIRYWFWRLDFYIWQHQKELFEKDSPELAIAENYIFKRNRSIEHIAPQTPQSNSMMKWDNTEEDERLRDSFGNLVMISQGLNSALSNESYEVKTAHVQSFCNGSKSGTIESLKLLIVHKNYPNGWNRKAIEEHGMAMYELLKKSVKE